MIRLRNLNRYRIANYDRYGADDEGGAFEVPSEPVRGTILRCIASNGEGWDHVSVSTEWRCPTWAEMEQIKRLFFKPDEVAMQLHVAVSDHISLHPFVLHLWRCHDQPIPLPPLDMV